MPHPEQDTFGFPTQDTYDLTSKVRTKFLNYHLYMIFALLCGATAVFMWAVQLTTGPNHVFNGLFDILKIAAVIGALGYFAKVNERAWTRRIQRIDQTVDRRLGRLERMVEVEYQRGRSDGFLEAAATRSLHSVR